MEMVAIPANLAAALHARLLADVRETQALANALTMTQPCGLVEPEPGKDTPDDEDQVNGN